MGASAVILNGIEVVKEQKVFEGLFKAGLAFESLKTFNQNGICFYDFHFNFEILNTKEEFLYSVSLNSLDLKKLKNNHLNKSLDLNDSNSEVKIFCFKDDLKVYTLYFEGHSNQGSIVISDRVYN